MKITGTIVKIDRFDEDGNSVFVFTVGKSEGGGMGSRSLMYNALFTARRTPDSTSELMPLLALAERGEEYTFDLENATEPPTAKRVTNFKKPYSVIGIEPVAEGYVPRED